MKKTYTQPQVFVVQIATTSIICTSPGVTSDKGINYGGVDEEGTIDPSSRRHRDMWDDEEDYLNN